MFGIFKSKTPAQKLEEQYKKLLEQSFLLSKTDRKAADAKMAEAEKIRIQLENLNK